MTVREFIERLSKLQPDMEVFYSGGNHRHDYRDFNTIEVVKEQNMFVSRGVYLGGTDKY